MKSIIAGLVIATVALGLRMASKIHSPCAGNDGWSTTLWWDDAVVVFVLALIIPIDVSAVLREFSFLFLLSYHGLRR